MADFEEPFGDKLMRIHWPHVKCGGKWKKGSPALKRLIHYGKKLSKLGMGEEEIAAMFGDLYWQAFGEFKNLPKEISEREGRDKLHFDEYGICFRLDEKELTAEELERDFEFCNNLVILNEKIWWTNSGGGAGGGRLPDFLNILRVDKTYAFGPTRKQRGWPPEKLAKLQAVGVYKLKPRAQPSRRARGGR